MLVSVTPKTSSRSWTGTIVSAVPLPPTVSRGVAVTHMVLPEKWIRTARLVCTAAARAAPWTVIRRARAPRSPDASKVSLRRGKATRLMAPMITTTIRSSMRVKPAFRCDMATFAEERAKVS